MRVNVEAKALHDPRFKKLGIRMGVTPFEAIGRCLFVWTMAYENRSEIASAEDIDLSADMPGLASALVEVGLASAYGDKVRLRGVEDRVQWLISQDRKRELALAAKRSRTPRVTSHGTPSGPVLVPRDVPLTPTPTPDLISLSGSGLSPELPDPDPDLGAVAGAEHGPTVVEQETPEPPPVAPWTSPAMPPPGIPRPGTGRNPRVQLNTDAWRYAAMKHAELALDGSMGWSAMPLGQAANDLTERTREVLAASDPPDYAAARALITRRIDVAAAEAKREGHVKWFTPSRMWDAKSFWRAVEMSPEQASKPRSPPRSSPTSPTPLEPRRIKTLG